MKALIITAGIVCALFGFLWLYTKGHIGVKESHITGKATRTQMIERNMKTEQLEIQHIRHATLILSVAGKKLLVDPMLASQGSSPPIPFTKNRVRNPLVALPIPIEAFNDIDGVLLTHLHIDHFDSVAAKGLPKNVPVFCQPSDAKKLRSFGYRQVIPISAEYTWDTLRIVRVKANHGTGLVTKLMGRVSGYVIQYGEARTVYVAGDAVFDETLEQNLNLYHPQTIIVNAGAARMILGSPITMTSNDVAKVCQLSLRATIIAVHMEAINHCGLSRQALKTHLEKMHLVQQVVIPDDGEVIHL